MQTSITSSVTGKQLFLLLKSSYIDDAQAVVLNKQVPGQVAAVSLRHAAVQDNYKQISQKRSISAVKMYIICTMITSPLV